MDLKVFSARSSGHFLNAICRTFLVGALGAVFSAQAVDAKTKRLDKESLKMADALAKDREAAFAGEKAMPVDEFQKRWTELANRLDERYGGHEVKLKGFGADIQYRKVFTLLIYMAFRAQTKGATLSPPPQEVVAKHPFLQELTVEGSCYTGGAPYPKKMVDLLKASPGMQFLLREHLAAWNDKLRKKFEKAFPEG